MRIKGTPVPICRLCENSQINEESIAVCKLSSTPGKCRKYKYDIFRYEPKQKTINTKFTKEDFEI